MTEASSFPAANTYRREIDGLRALAVLPVIGFHAGFPLFQGGFVGVDVFFVISGYLITGLILAEQQAGHFSLARFYERRARRILPALFTVLAVSSGIAWFRLLPSDLKAFAGSLTGVAGFYANFVFARETGYFDTAAELKPLLHTWSLAVEEQFYLLFPAVLLLTRRWGPVSRGCLLAALGLASLVAAERGVYRPAEAVFLLQTRSWAVMIGALAAFYDRHRTPAVSPGSAQLASALGLALVLLPVFTFSRHTPFPGLYGLVPTVGAALLLLFATPGTVVGAALSSAPLAGLGLISYGAYLWHQPLFAFARHNTPAPPGPATFLWLSLAALVLAYASWRWIEQPFRTSARLRRVHVAIFAVTGSALFAALGAIGVANEGFAAYYIDHRLSPADRALYQLVRDHTSRHLSDDMVDDGACHFWAQELTPAFEARFTGCQARFGPAVIVLGDSHAMNVYNLVAKANVAPFVAGVAKPGCRPQNDNPDCHYGAFGRFVNRHADDIRVVLFNQSGSYFLEDRNGELDTREAFAPNAPFILHDEGITVAVDYLKALARHVPTVWLGPYTDARVDFRDLSYLSRGLHMSDVALRHYALLEDELQRRARAGRWPFRHVSLHDLFKPSSEFVRVGDCITFRDTDHFSACGEDLLAPTLKRAWDAGRLAPSR